MRVNDDDYDDPKAVDDERPLLELIMLAINGNDDESNIMMLIKWKRSVTQVDTTKINRQEEKAKAKSVTFSEHWYRRLYHILIYRSTV